MVGSDPLKGKRVNPEIVKLNPDGKVPILIHENKVLLESLAIMEYINSISETGGLVPVEFEVNYEFRRKLHYGLTEIEPYIWVAEQSKGPLSKYYRWPEGVYDESIARVTKTCQSVGSYIASNDFMIESGFSIADIYYYHILTWAKQHGIKHEEKLEGYLSKLESRKCFPTAMHWAS